MPTSTKRISAATIVLLLLLLVADRSYAQPRRQAALSGLGPNSKTTLVVAALVTTVGVIGVGVYLGIRQRHTAKGCVTNGVDGLELQTSDKIVLLLGNTTDIKPGQRFKLTGSKKKKLTGVTERPSFVVERVNKTYGQCSLTRP